MEQTTHLSYFENRAQAGQIIAQHLFKYRYEEVVVLALSEGGALVGAEIAKELHSLLILLMVKDIYLPDGQTVIGSINETGGFIYNNAFSVGEIEEFDAEYRAYIEQAKMQAVHDLHIALGKGGEISKEYFRKKVVVVVTDGALNGSAFDMAYDYLKKIDVRKVVMVTPVASVAAVDRMHVLADELLCLSVVESVFSIDHYYKNNIIPDRKGIVNIINQIIMSWNRQAVL